MSEKTLTMQTAIENSPELLRNAVDSRITKIRPMATPIDQISRMSGVKHVNSMMVNFYSVDSKPVTTEVAKRLNLGATEAKPEVGKVLKLTVKDASMFNATDTVMFPAHSLTADGKSGVALTAYVSEVLTPADDDHQLMLSFFEDYNGEIQAGETVVRMGRAASELDVQTGSYIAVPVHDYNYCQIFKMQIEQSTLMRLAEKEVAWTFSEQEEAAVIDMRLGMEKNFLFGRRGRVLDTVKNEYVYLTNGIWNQAGRETVFDISTATVDSFITLCREIFTGNNGSRKRMLIGGSEFIEAVSKMPVTDKVIMGQTHNKWGLETREIITNFGTLNILHSEVFDQCGHSKDAFVLDQNFLTKFSHMPFKPERLNLRASGTRNADAVVLTEASCLVLRNPNVHMRVLGSL